jgi:hypothetical protein
MRDPTVATDLVIKELIEITIQYLCERDMRETCEAFDAAWARCENYTWEDWDWDWRPPARKRGRPSQRRARHIQIAGAVAMLVEDAGLHPTRSHASRRRRDPSACSIVAAALEQLSGPTSTPASGERFVNLAERAIEDIWNQYRLSPLIIHQGATDYARNHRYRVSSGIIH